LVAIASQVVSLQKAVMSESEKRIPPFGLRLPPDLKEKVQAAAKANNRSMNAEIAVRLERTFHEFSQMDEEQLEVVKAVYQGLVSGVANQMIAQGLDATKSDIEDYMKARNKEVLGRILNISE
jgi:hypothetical protein